jgi:putative transposase
MQVKEVEIVPQTIYGITYYMLHLIYKKPVIQEPIKEGNILSIDLGIKNLATAVINTGSAIIYDGRRLISKFRWFAKIKGKLQSELRRSGELQNPKDFVQIVVGVGQINAIPIFVFIHPDDVCNIVAPKNTTQ